MSGPLAGLRVVEVGVAMAGPYCAMTLGDFGAEVVKIERVGAGDDSRSWPPHFFGAMGYYYGSANRNKRSVALDLKTPEGAAVARRLIEGADILVDNYRIGALARAGLDWETLRAANPRLIYCSISGFGASGPRAEEPANDLFMQAYAGGMSITGEEGGGPVKMGMSVADIGAGMLATIGVMMAVEARHRTGRGQRVDTSLLEGQMSMLAHFVTRYFASDEVPGPSGSGALTSPTYRAYRASDDWIVISAFNQRMWRGLCAALDRPEWVADPRFADAALRVANRLELIDLIGAAVATRRVAEWEMLLRSNEVPCCPINRIDKVVAEEQVAARDMVMEIDLPGLGAMRMAGLPVKLSETPAAIGLPPPRLGQHTAEVMRGAGYADEEIEALARRGAIGLDEGWREGDQPRRTG
ncbi:CaiB/BaiF CoA transferase family protein [Pararoseomonas indoligenes]|uniref:CoA transferase n=1 Tax=Roseomonas indoligenes TaxID=2820811 RepID=A0A940N3M7_9PROT|nr:CoA transferase [Pararoseomonas indoligenes]MBP0495406.1 CoA transferase [Pararoseomonas indoligenes]